MTRSIVFPIVLLAACQTGSDEVFIPQISDINMEADGQIGLVDRAAALELAVDAEFASPGVPLATDGLSQGFLMDVDSSRVSPETEGTEGAPPSFSFYNIAVATGMVVTAEVATAAVIGPPSFAINYTVHGDIERVAPNVWEATNSLRLDGQTIDTRLTVAWIEVGYLAEMRLRTEDGSMTDEVWFNGFVSENHALGWWDIYDQGTRVGVVEWVDNGLGAAQLGIISTDGDTRGDMLSWWHSGDEAAVSFMDASEAEEAYVYVAEDRSGELRHVDYNEGAPACWDVELLDTECE